MSTKGLLVTAPLGWKIINGKEIPDENEQQIINIVRGFRATGFSYKHIARVLTKGHFTTREGGVAKFTEYEAKIINDAETIEERRKRE